MIRSRFSCAAAVFSVLGCASAQTSPAAPAAAAAQAGATPASSLRVDQHGYVPNARKQAIWVNAAASGAGWDLLDGAGQVVARGTTTPFGEDAESGDVLEQLDFSAYTATGKGFTLRVGQDSSHPFDIAPDLYAPLFRDAARYFYLNRSGVPLEMPYVADPALARPAGHLSDARVPCLPDSGCDYTLDVHGGWYDAGDYGKYVVNGGLSVWLLLDAYELAAEHGQAAWFPDGQLGIPEGQNGVSDLLDEARFELAFLLEMQVPEGQPLSGMVHHKIHDKEWSALGKPPTPQTDVPRYLHPPSTAATLNLAAVGAVAARLYAASDAAFAKTCLAAARRAFESAQKNPARLAPNGSHTGGGPYGDEQLSDELYWAAAELWVTTREPGYAELVRKSPHFRAASSSAGGVQSSFDWATTDMLGSFSLLLHPDLLGPDDSARLRQEVEHRADGYLALIEKQGYRFPLVAADGGYPWGSNSFVTDNAIVLSFAHHLTGKRPYLEGAYEAMHYVLGRNANDYSYVSGYGERALSHPHHRFWARSVDPRLPGPPPGALSGGPNSRLQDPPMKAKQQGCKPQKCYLDELPAYSVNEVAINWNASLAWVSAYLAQQ